MWGCHHAQVVPQPHNRCCGCPLLNLLTPQQPHLNHRSPCHPSCRVCHHRPRGQGVRGLVAPCRRRRQHHCLRKGKCGSTNWGPEGCVVWGSGMLSAARRAAVAPCFLAWMDRLTDGMCGVGRLPACKPLCSHGTPRACYALPSPITCKAPGGIAAIFVAASAWI